MDKTTQEYKRYRNYVKLRHGTTDIYEVEHPNPGVWSITRKPLDLPRSERELQRF